MVDELTRHGSDPAWAPIPERPSSRNVRLALTAKAQLFLGNPALM
jgi:hypothetical protein